MSWQLVYTLIVDVVIFGILVPAVLFISKLIAGMKCQLRNDMLRIYYRDKDTKKIRQYEFQNFVYLYDAYKALKGNSFIDKIYADIKTWEIVD